jgi:tetratricopeptide (TPR) repeat protein
MSDDIKKDEIVRRNIRLDLFTGIALAAFAAIVYFLSLAGYAYPGESARLQALWRGLDVSAESSYPLMKFFAMPFGASNVMAPILGVLAVFLLYRCVLLFVRSSMYSETVFLAAPAVSRIAAAVSAVVFMLTPAVRGAATHLEPRLFDVVWALASVSILFSYMRSSTGKRAYAFLALAGALAGAGFCNSVLFAPLLLVMVFVSVKTEFAHDRHLYAALSVLMASFFITFLSFQVLTGFDIPAFITRCSEDIAHCTRPGWVLIGSFTLIPFLAVLFSSERVYNEPLSLVQYLYQMALSLLAVLATATVLSPSSLMDKWGEFPVFTSAFAAFISGHLVSYWYLRKENAFSIAAFAILSFVLGFVSIWNLFSFDSNRGSFADRIAARAIDDLGERRWLVTDGVIDSHLLLQAEKKGCDLTLISLSRDSDPVYLKHLEERIRAKKVGGSKNEQLILSLSLGVLPFVQDWLACDPTVPKTVAIWGAPDLWFSAGLRPIPEFLFFGADEARALPDWKDWTEYDKILSAPQGWGSYKSFKEENAITRLKYSLRRHFGLVANNRGVYLQDLKRDDEAFAFFERVLGEIDCDNVSSLFNEVEMSGRNHPGATAKRVTLESRVKALVDDKTRRYAIWRLSSYYGYIRNPDMFVRLGFSWARTGRPGDALAQIRRAIDFVPREKQIALLNMMAALYANENDRQKSREIYEQVLKNNSNDHDALVGMMRLELLRGDKKAALSYLERAVATSSKDGRLAKIELSMVAMMKGNLKEAKSLLLNTTEENPKDLLAWSLLAAVAMQQWDAAKDEKVKASLRKDIAEKYLPAMEKNTNNPYDYYLQITKAFLMMRSGNDKLRQARDAFAAAARSRPDSLAAQDLVLGLDITLNDKVSAEVHARDVLYRNRNAPLANYVMGSLQIDKGGYSQAEMYLRKAADAPQPNVLAMNDLAEVLRRTGKFDEAERYARRATEKAPELYIVWETLGVVLMDAGKDAAEAEKCIRKAIDLQQGVEGNKQDIRMWTSLARAQFMRGDKKGAKMSLRKVRPHLAELAEYERREFKEMEERVK